MARRKYLTSEQFEEAYGAHPEALRQLRKFADDHGLLWEEALPAASLCVLSGTVERFNEAFGVDLLQFEVGEAQKVRIRVGPIYLPTALARWVLGVHGLDNRPEMRRLFAPHLITGPGQGLEPAELRKHYRFPGGYDGTGETIALLHFGQGIRPGDLEHHFTVTTSRLPKILPIKEIFGGKNNPQGSLAEPTMDLAMSGGLAPGSRFVSCFAPGTTAGIVHGFAEMIHDRKHRPSVISVSWGSPEATATPQFYDAVNDQLRSAALLGITICCSTGDKGSSAGRPPGRHVEFAASSPYVLACGGSEFQTLEDQLVELVWQPSSETATGGGVSRLFRRSRWQAHAMCRIYGNLTETVRAPCLTGGISKRRILPDVCAQAVGFPVHLPDLDEPAEFSGTSCSAPIWAALVACLNEGMGRRTGFINPVLYRSARKSITRDVMAGNNGAFFARKGWDACTGLGSPNGEALLRLLRSGR